MCGDNGRSDASRSAKPRFVACNAQVAVTQSPQCAHSLLSRCSED